MEQERLQLPGLAKECKEICRELNLPNLMKEDVPCNQWKNMVKKACKEASEKDLTSKMSSMSKVKELAAEKFERKDYFNTQNIHQARTMFKARTKMLDFKRNFSHDPKYSKELWRCDSCKSGDLESQSHVLYCTAYKDLRQGKDLNSVEDLVTYFTDVLSIRTQLGLVK